MGAVILGALGVAASAAGFTFCIVKRESVIAVLFFIIALVFSAGLGTAISNL